MSPEMGSPAAGASPCGARPEQGKAAAERRWLLVVRTEERPGVAETVTAAFSGRGITIESFLGYGGGALPGAAAEGALLITFRALEQRMETVRRTLRRLEVVRDVEVCDYEREERLVKTATLELSKPAAELRPLAPDSGVTATLCGGGVLVVTGRAAEVDRALERLRESGGVAACVFSLFLRPAEKAR